MEIPHHIAIIMDGNGRWAKAHGLPRTIGHKRGIERVKEVVRNAKNLGVKIVTIFAFSTENWSRPGSEIKMLFAYLKFFLKSYKGEMMEEGVRFKVIGRRNQLDKSSKNAIEEVEKLTANNNKILFNVCIDYGGRWDIVEAAKNIAHDCRAKKINEQDINEKLFSRYLSLGGIPDPDLLIRTSGEQRISNFLLWNLAYSELYFSETFWPDFSLEELKKSLEIYAQRERRFGRA